MIISALIFLVSCNRVPQGERPVDTATALRQVQTGTQGVEISLLPDYPPSILYDQDNLIAIVDVKNKGNHNLEPQECFLQITGFDPSIIRGGMEQPRSCSEGYGILEGKSVYNLEGGYNQLEFRSSSIDLPQNVFEYNPVLNFVSCYNYHTTANPEVCVDPLLYQIASEQKTCKPMDVSMSGGQGAPVGVTYVGVDMIGDRAIFEINIRNMGSGKVLSPFADIRSCGQASIDYNDLDKVGYTVQMSGGSLVDCKPRDGMVRMVNNQGKIVCSVNVPGASAYKTPLLIDLDYSYLQSLQRTVKIIQTPQ